ncbi:MAG: Asp-tRNA(Asn)/Glu-tRNA(Gln) amidotransferase subunit GatA [Candidatus Omnitrophica bacterium]|nr:Asp-tRNA(Asn)/Glu-tRNA(Gln) amidotransferase subunit GatA [Candidatus Omnitrophota bacterium]
MTDDLYKLTLTEAVRFAGENSAAPLLDALRDRVAAVNPKINAILRFDPKRVIQADPRETVSTGLNGVPVAIKDNICIDGVETTCASKILKGHIPPYHAAVIQKILASGGTLFGQCNMDEFAFGSSSETSAYGLVRNPWNTECVPGGSSGGSAAAVASDMAFAALGSDTGGSIRQPAAFCGVVGLKPTYGRVSRYGLIAFGSSFDQIGPLTKNVEDAALLMNVIAGHDPMDSTSVNVPVPDYVKGLKRDVKGLRIGLPEEFFIEGLDGEIEKSVRQAAETLKRLGAEIKTIQLPHTPQSVAVYYIVAVAEASSNLGRFDGVRYGFRADTRDLKDMYLQTREQGFGAEAKRRILLGTFVLSSGYYDAYYLKGQKVRTLIRHDFAKAFEEVDLILSPTAPTAAFKIGEKTDPLSMYLSDIFTIPANLAGVPAISLPCGVTSEGLPIGLQLMGRHFEEETLLRAAYTFEKEIQLKQKPQVVSAG